MRARRGLVTLLVNQSSSHASSLPPSSPAPLAALLLTNAQQQRVPVFPWSRRRLEEKAGEPSEELVLRDASVSVHVQVLEGFVELFVVHVNVKQPPEVLLGQGVLVVSPNVVEHDGQERGSRTPEARHGVGRGEGSALTVASLP